MHLNHHASHLVIAFFNTPRDDVENCSLPVRHELLDMRIVKSSQRVGIKQCKLVAVEGINDVLVDEVLVHNDNELLDVVCPHSHERAREASPVIKILSYLTPYKFGSKIMISLPLNEK